MSEILISSTTNDHFKRWKKLSESPRNVRKFGTSLAEGIHLAQVIAGQDVRVSSVIVRETGITDEAQELAQRISESKDTRIYVLSASLYDQVSPVEHGAGLALEFVVPQFERPLRAQGVDALYLDGVQDAGNMGTLIRTAVAAGVRHIAASAGSCGFWSPKVLRAGMGAHFGATLYENVDAEELHGLFSGRRLAADAHGGRDLFRSAGWADNPTVWMMGSEGSGLSSAALSVADVRYLIPIEEACESLNVGAAAAVCLFEQRRRRLLKEQ